MYTQFGDLSCHLPGGGSVGANYSVCSKTSSGDPTILDTQRMLADLGFYKGPVDGKADPSDFLGLSQTLKDAQVAFLKSKGIDPCGPVQDPCVTIRNAWQAKSSPLPKVTIVPTTGIPWLYVGLAAVAATSVVYLIKRRKRST